MLVQSELIKSLEINSSKVAIETYSTKITYEELLMSSNKLTKFLLQNNVEKQTLVGVYLDKRADIIISSIGILNARCVFVPLDVSLPENNIKSIIKDLNIRYIVTSKNPNKIDVIAKEFSVMLVTFEEILETENSNSLIEYPQYQKDDNVYVYFTSGSTGRPKGIIGKNSSLIQFLDWEIRSFDIDSSFRFSQLISPYFDAFLRDVFVPLLSGSTICIPPTGKDFLLSERIISWIDDNKISIIHCVPSLFRLINHDSITSERFSHLKYVMLSGERISPAELKPWYDIIGDRIQLLNLYGTTETTMIRTYYKIKPEDVNKKTIPIGFPISDTEILISNDGQEDCSVLVPGELYIISDYVTSGYLNAPELTHERFIKKESKKLGETIAFKTGDKARMQIDGMFELLGREDRQVKVRGVRIELEEIENVLIKHNSIKSAVVLKHIEENNEETLLAFIIRNHNLNEEQNSNFSLEMFLNDHLPEYMIPSKFIEVSDYPFLTNGKINYQELKKKLTKQTIIPPSNKIEIKLLSIWKDILGDKPISVEESFHNAGGNSLSIMRLIGKIYNEFSIRVSLSELFSNLTIRKQAKYIEELNIDNLYKINKATDKPYYSLTNAQERIFFMYELDKNSTAYNLPMAWEIIGEYDKSKIEDIFKILIERHESLRTKFVFEDNKLVQKIENSFEFEVDEIIIKSDISSEIDKFIRPFDLSTAPLFRASVIKSDNRKVLIADVHHIICDGMSQMNLYSDFLQLYEGRQLEPNSLQYKDYAEWERDFSMTEEYFSNREFWLKSFEGDLPKLELPTTNLNVNEISDKGLFVNFKIEKRVLQSLVEVLEEEEITTFSGLLALYFTYISHLSGQDDIIVGIVTSGRMQEELHDMVGMFAKTLPIRYDIEFNNSFRVFAKNLHRYLIEANSKQIYDLSDIVDELNKSRNTPIENLFDTLFVFQNFEDKKYQINNEDFIPFDYANTTSKYPISMVVSEEEYAFNFSLEYSNMFFAEEDASILITQFKELVENISNNIDTELINCIGNEIDTAPIIEDDVSFEF